MKGFNSVASYQQLYYILGHPKFVQRQMAKELDIKHGGKIQTFVKWLEDLKLVVRTYETKKGKATYEVPSRDALLTFYSRFRNMKNEQMERTYQIGIDRKETIQFLSDNGGIMCLTTALQFYDNYFRDPTIHVYVKDPILLAKVHSQVEGKIKVVLYNFELPDESKIVEGVNVTSPIRTIIDLYCNNMSYAAEQFIKKVWT